MPEPSSCDLIAPPKKPRRLRGSAPLSAASRRRMITALAVAAVQGNTRAAEALIRLSLAAEETRRVSALVAGITLERST